MAQLVTERVEVLTIGIGAGRYCDGQVLVYQDMLGYTGTKMVKFAKQYADLHGIMLEAFKQYKTECASRSFPDDEHTFAISEEIIEELKAAR